MDWNQIRSMMESGRLTIGSHSVSHPLLAQLPHQEIEVELTKSKEVIEEKVGSTVHAFSYPFGVKRYGAYSEETEKLVRKAGYRCSFTAEIGRTRFGNGPFLIPKIPLVNADSEQDIMAKTTGAWDWVGLAQRTYQTFTPNPHLPNEPTK